jgi:hypothetical protein
MKLRSRKPRICPRDSLRGPCGTLYPQNFAQTWPTSGDRSIGIVQSQTQTTEFFIFLFSLSVVPYVLNVISIYFCTLVVYAS